MKKAKVLPSLTTVLLSLCLVFSACDFAFNSYTDDGEEIITLENIPEYSGEPYVVINGNEPFFTEDEMTDEAFEEYGELDYLGRCQTAFACVCQELMPTEKRGDISRIKPSGWHSYSYDCVDGESLYNRCHLIGFQLSGENDNERNLITGTRYLNVDGMLPFENMIADYIKETDNHILYRVTPMFKGENLVADGVLMEAKSVEDNGDGVCFNVYAYNVQPGIEIDYLTGESWVEGEKPSDNGQGLEYILNTNTKKFHLTTCALAEDIKPQNREEYTGTREDLINMGYSPCGKCNP